MGKSYSQSIWNVLLTTVKNGYEKIKKVNLHLKKRGKFFKHYFQKSEIEPQTTVPGQPTDWRDRCRKQEILDPVSQSEKTSTFTNKKGNIHQIYCQR